MYGQELIEMQEVIESPNMSKVRAYYRKNPATPLSPEETFEFLQSINKKRHELNLREFQVIELFQVEETRVTGDLKKDEQVDTHTKKMEDWTSGVVEAAREHVNRIIADKKRLRVAKTTSFELESEIIENDMNGINLVFKLALK